MFLRLILLVSQFPNLWGYKPRRFSFALRFCIGTLEPISGLVQLERLHLNDCENLTGTICCSGTTRELTHWLIPGTLAPLAGLSQLQSLVLGGFKNCKLQGQKLNLCGHNQHVISLADF